MMHPAITGILRWFEYDHLTHYPARLVAKEFYTLAHNLAADLPSDPEKIVALRHLLDSKTASVLAVLSAEPSVVGD